MRKILLLAFLGLTISLSACSLPQKDRIENSSENKTLASSEDSQAENTVEAPENSQAENTVEVPATEAKTEESTTEAQVWKIEDYQSLAAGTIISLEDLDHLDISQLFFSQKINDEIFERIDGISYGEDCIVSRDELRYLHILHMGFDGQVHVGEIICHEDLKDDFLEIFQELYENSYPIEKVLLVDEYDGDDELSMEDNNTSCFNFRPVPGSDHLSQHAYGRAIDINPLYNPYVTSSGYTPYNAGDYVDRNQDIPYKIDYDDLCYQLFENRGFTWGGDWNSVKDYQHFQRK